MPEINYIAVFVATIAAMAVGFVWYEPRVFGSAWMQLVGLTPDKIKETNMAPVLGGSFATTLVTAWLMANLMELTSATLPFAGAFLGALIGLGFVATAMFNAVLYAKQPIKLFLINASYQTVTLVIIGFVIGLF